MKMFKSKALQAIVLSLVLAATLALAVGCAGQQGSSSASAQAQGSSSAQAQRSGSAPTSEQYDTAFNPTGVVSTFIGEKFYDQKVTDEESALAAVKSAYSRIGADDTTELQATAIRPTETGTTYYIFNQVAGDVLVHGASVKLITNKDNEAIALVSAVLPKVQIPKAETWQITAAQAEEAVVKECESDGHAGTKPLEGATEQVLIPVPKLDNKMQFAWVVYTPNYDTDSEMPYLAHYVDGSGEYLYAIPINEPHNADAESGDKANFDFGKFEQSTWTGALKLHDGTTKDVELPVLVDKSDNTTILADGKRKILCADYAKWANEETLAPSTSADNTFDNTDLLAYDTFIKVWDFYDSIGWTAPDGEGTPTLLLMNYVNSAGEPVDQAFYWGRQHGFQVFTFNRLNPDGENMDIVAHEFTHCVTTTTMTTNIYLNEMGAINEGMSDVLGNLVEMIVVNKPETAWLLGDSSGVGTLRSMKEPHEFRQPEFRWDTYYAPNVLTGTDTNDRGGVHDNSSLLNIVSYKLDQAGMAPNDQFYFWMNVALAMTPRTDYVQMAELLPWCMEQSGYAQYVDALKKAIDEAGYTKLDTPTTPPAGDGAVSIAFDAPELSDQGLVCFAFIPAASDALLTTWPTAGTTKATCTLPAGDYTLTARLGSERFPDCTVYVYTDAGWKLETSGAAGSTIHVDEGKTLEISADGLPTTLDAVGK